MTESQRRAEQAILVVNAGSSSLKFCVYRVADQGELEETARGLLDGIGVRPHFSARVLGDGKEEKRDLAASEAGDHGGAIPIVADWLRGPLAGALPVALRHRVVHGGGAHGEPLLRCCTVLGALPGLRPPARPP